MIASVRTQSAAVLVDIENFINAKELFFRFPERAIGQVISGLRVHLWKQGLRGDEEWSRIYLASRAYPTRAVLQISRAAAEQHFKLRWSLRSWPAERLLISDITTALSSKQTISLPHSIFILSGDGGVISTVNLLQQRGHDVTVIACAQRIHHTLKQRANTFISIEEILARAVHP